MTGIAGRGDLDISGTFNARAVGGLPTRDGRTVRNGLLFRTAHLGGLDDAGRRALRDLGVVEVIDLRSPAECKAEGFDVLPSDIHWQSLPFDPNRISLGARTLNGEQAHAHMIAVYRTYPTLNGAKRAIAKIITLIAQQRPVLVHCTAGKDRTGWAVASVLRAAGVAERSVVDDYRASNAAVEDLRMMTAARHPDAASIPREYLGVLDDYLAAADAAMVAEYGDIESYLAACGIGPDKLAEFRANVTAAE